jgi:legumain
MHSKNMYNKLTFYLETCESGSMFEGMTTPGVYALSAAGPSESSWGTYCGSDAMVNGKSIGSCLGDLFSVNWMEDSDVTDLTSETLQQQSDTVTTKTDKSKVMQWGDLSFQSDKVSEYQSGPSSSATGGQASKDPSRSAISARELELKQAYDNYASAQSSKKRLAAGEQLQSVLKDQLAVEAAYEKFLEIVYPGDEAKKAAARDSENPAATKAAHKSCELAARDSFKEHGVFDSYTGFALQFHRYIVNVCADVAATGSNIDVAQAAKQACQSSVVV